MIDYIKEAEGAIEELKSKRTELLERLGLVSHAIDTNMRVIELAKKVENDGKG